MSWDFRWLRLSLASGHARGLVVEGVRERDPLDVPGERAIDEEAHRHIAPLIEAKVLGRETEAFGLVEVRRHLGGRDVGHRLGHGVPAGEVACVELRRVELPGVHFDGAYHGELYTAQLYARHLTGRDTVAQAVRLRA